ncbi:MAG: glycoside hydrolase family 3 C-terminal domain-containing protein [Prevotella sp.]|nr:glycoside hydrolase family 3 C-terminal domain-containing protein [Prevotella sp.]
MKRTLLSICLVCCGFTAATSQVYKDPKAPIEERVKDALSRMTTHEKVQLLHAQSKFTSAGVPRLGIRQLNMDDGPHGVRAELEWNTWMPAKWTNDSVVAFPSLTCLAATWNPELARLYGHAVSEEFAFRAKDIMLGPGCTIARTPLCGRNFEYTGEDPYLAGEIVTPYIQGAQANGVACCLKHFFLNNQEIDRFTVNVNVSRRAIEEIYLPAFKKAVTKGGLWTIMGSYNLWNNIHCCQNDSLLNGILKRGWGFDGAVISDWSGVTDTWQAATGGMDIEMGSFTDGFTKESEFGYNDYFLADKFEALINEGKIPMSVLDDKATRVLRTIFRTSMNADKVVGSQCSEEHYDACQAIGEEGIVLLKNDRSLLPLDATKYARILVVGENATRSLTEGGGSSELKTLFDIAPLDGLRALYGDKITYAQGYYSGRALYGFQEPLDAARQDSLRQDALDNARTADLIIYVGGLNKNAKQDCESNDRESYDLSFGQNELISQLAKIQPNIVVVTFGGNAYATPWLSKVPALVHCWYLGSMAGTALANVLSGKVNPSGKLPVTFAVRQQDYPCFQYGEKAYPGVNGQVFYDEGIYVGYRWFNSLMNTKKIKPQFPFGHGLSYTTFKYGKPVLSGNRMSSQQGGISVTLPVTNTGSVKGKEIVQLYIGDDKCSVDRPAKELKGFSKVELLPGETKSVTFQITADDLSFFDEAAAQWRVEPGKFTAYFCASEADIRQKASFTYE